MIKQRNPRKLEHNWKYVGSGCYDSNKGVRVHVGGLIVARSDNPRDTAFRVDEFSCLSFRKAMMIMMSRKRAIMLYAEYLYEIGANQ